MTGVINVVGLGAGDVNQLSVGIYNQLKTSQRLFVRTAEHPVISDLKQELSFHSFDELYIKHEDFDSVYQAIVDRLALESEEGDVVYAVPGHPMVAEKTVQLLLEAAEQGRVKVNVKGGQSFIDPLFTALNIDPIDGFYFCDALDLDADQLPLTHHTIICQVYDAFMASEVKLSLMERLPADYEVMIVRSVGNSDQQIIKLPLFELDRCIDAVDNLTSVYVPPVTDESLLYGRFSTLRKVIKQLRGPEGCPWNRKQTHQSLRKYLIEEAFEVIGAIEEGDDDHLAEELGDVLLQVMLHAQIGEDEGYFDIKDVMRVLTEKMIRRHPHVFGEETAETAEEVSARWEAIKAQERGTASEHLFDSIEKGLPPLMLANELQKQAAQIGFDWSDPQVAWEKVAEELKEVQQEVRNEDKQKLEQELGDVLFSLVNLSRHYKIDPSLALQATNQKFMKRLSGMETMAVEMGHSLSTMNLKEMDELWEKVKKNE
ncbi:MazG family protein [Pullulanibacillus camelliae]|uniref:MazG family protein n=1 Tax=Pullulanibacillus camelliae TaxID=1707096 RepID=A0A8J2YMP3_9BACL|nr:nucleoside triphosphate pyrophosphohydrolase [Pullulanibacillus camelliae]GGE54070.1 MazG family protein [Pullulanibacillus camelliae]